MAQNDTFQWTFATVAVLSAISRGHRYGFDIMEATGLPSGTVYPALRRLEQSELLRSDWEQDDVALGARRPRRRYYELTPPGVRALEMAWARFPMLATPAAAAGTDAS